MKNTFFSLVAMVTCWICAPLMASHCPHAKLRVNMLPSQFSCSGSFQSLGLSAQRFSLRLPVEPALWNTTPGPFYQLTKSQSGSETPNIRWRCSAEKVESSQTTSINWHTCWPANYFVKWYQCMSDQGHRCHWGQGSSFQDLFHFFPFRSRKEYLYFSTRMQKLYL